MCCPRSEPWARTSWACRCSAYGHRPFAHDLELEFRLLSDSHPRGGAARAYGVYRPRLGTSEWALFVVDVAGVIRWHYLAPPEVNLGVDRILTALEALAKGKEAT